MNNNIQKILKENLTCFLIPENEMKELLSAYHILNILERDGVDNWEWYMASLSDYLEEDGLDPEKNDLEDLVEKDLKENYVNMPINLDLNF